MRMMEFSLPPCHQVNESLSDLFFVNFIEKTRSKKLKKSLKLMHLHKNASLGTTLCLVISKVH